MGVFHDFKATAYISMIKGSARFPLPMARGSPLLPTYFLINDSGGIEKWQPARYQFRMPE